MRRKRDQKRTPVDPEVYERVRNAAETVEWNLKHPGRPSKYHEGFCHLVEQATIIGAIKPELAVLLGVGGDTVDRWMREFPQFQAAIKRGRERADAQVEKALHARALGYSHPEDKIFCHEGAIITAETVKHYPPDTAAAFIWLKNRQPGIWRDRMDVNVVDPDEAAKRVREKARLMREAGG